MTDAASKLEPVSAAAARLCPICRGAMTDAFDAVVLQRHRAQYENCSGCGFLRARDPHWLEEAYSSAIAATDTGLVARNTELARKVASLLYFTAGERGAGRYLDAAGGYGLLTRLMRDRGMDFYWADKYCENLLARGFEFKPELAPCRAVTAFEVMEHLEDPAGFVAEVLADARSGMFIFTTVLFEGAPPPAEWWYYAFATGQHIAFFQRRTLATLARKLGLHFYSASGLHLFSADPLSSLRLRIGAGRLSHLLAPLARAALGGKTQPDHEEITRRLQAARGAPD